MSEDHMVEPSGTMYQSIHEQITKTIEVAQSHGIRRPVLSAKEPAKTPMTATNKPATACPQDQMVCALALALA